MSKPSQDKDNKDAKSHRTILGQYSRFPGSYYSKPSEVIEVFKKIFNATRKKQKKKGNELSSQFDQIDDVEKLRNKIGNLYRLIANYQKLDNRVCSQVPTDYTCIRCEKIKKHFDTCTPSIYSDCEFEIQNG